MGGMVCVCKCKTAEKGVLAVRGLLFGWVFLVLHCLFPFPEKERSNRNQRPMLSGSVTLRFHVDPFLLIVSHKEV